MRLSQLSFISVVGARRLMEWCSRSTRKCASIRSWHRMKCYRIFLLELLTSPRKYYLTYKFLKMLKLFCEWGSLWSPNILGYIAYNNFIRRLGVWNAWQLRWAACGFVLLTLKPVMVSKYPSFHSFQSHIYGMFSIKTFHCLQSAVYRVVVQA